MRLRKFLTPLSLAVAAAALIALPTHDANARSLALSGTSSPQTGDFTPSGGSDTTQAEFPGQLDEEDGGPGPYPGTITNRSLSKGTGNGVSVNSGKKAK